MNLVAMTGVGLRRGVREILTGIDWTMRKNEHWAVIGANGSGKTSLLKIVGGTLYPTCGAIAVLGQTFGKTDLLALRRRIGWVGPALLWRMPPNETALQIVASGLKATFGLVYEMSESDRLHAVECLGRVGLEGKENAEFGVMSQGEQQRVLFARMLTARPELLILDEACGGLDLSARETFLAVVGDTMRRGDAGVIMVTHHIEELPVGITHALVLKDGAVLAAGPVAETVTGAVLSEAFGLDVAVECRDGRYWARADLTRRAGANLT